MHTDPRQWQRLTSNLNRRQEKLRALLSLERQWPDTVDPETVSDLIRRQQILLENLENLAREWADTGDGAGAPAGVGESLRQVRDQVRAVLDQHQRNLANLQARAAAAGEAFGQARSELELVRKLRQSLVAPSRLDLAG
jgi:uncharacterized protein YhaN